MERSTNALAELAYQLKQTPFDGIKDGIFSLRTYDVRNILKAQRIVAELAKVNVVKVHSLKEKEVVEIDYPEREDANIAFLNSRAIAEE